MRLLALTVALALVALQDGEPQPQEDPWLDRLARDGRTVRLEHTAGLECATCHQDVAEEWRHSTHATAWQDEHYQRELRRTRKKDRCHGCHAPSPMIPAGLPARPMAREENRHLGVECRSCHLAADGETVLGPYGSKTTAHATELSPLFTGEDNSLCISCHSTTIGPVIGIAKDFVDSKQAELDLSCIGCHMPGLRGPIANDEEGGEYPVRKRRSHRLNTPRDPVFLASAFGLSAEIREGRAVLSIENRAGHRVPGTTRRELTFRVQVVDRHGDVVATEEHTIDHLRYLPVEETVEVELEEPGVSLRVRGMHDTDGLRRPQKFLEVELALE